MLLVTGTKIPNPAGEDKTLHPGGVPRNRSDLVDGLDQAEGERCGNHGLVLPRGERVVVERHSVEVARGRDPTRGELVLPLELVEVGAEAGEVDWTKVVSTNYCAI
jgi:hypothetical protein